MINAQGRLETGGVASADEKGYGVYTVGRKKELILVPGFNVYPGGVADVF